MSLQVVDESDGNVTADVYLSDKLCTGNKMSKYLRCAMS